jgi:hypothetical protein
MMDAQSLVRRSCTGILLRDAPIYSIAQGDPCSGKTARQETRPATNCPTFDQIRAKYAPMSDGRVAKSSKHCPVTD